MNKLGRSIFLDCVRDSGKLKALAFLLYVKNNFTASTVHGHSLAVLAKRLNIHHSVVYRSMTILREMQLIEKTTTANGKKLIIFKSVRTDGVRLNIEKLQKLPYDQIIVGLRALFIVDIQKRKNYISQKVVNTVNSMNSGGRKGATERYKELRKNGLIEEKVDVNNEKTGVMCSKFKDHGISFSFLTDQLCVGRSSVNKAIQIGKRLGWFIKRVIERYDEFPGYAMSMAQCMDSNSYLYATKDRVYYERRNRFFLLPSL